jgi:hypothetical protein
MDEKKKQWIELYKTSTCDGYFKNGRWFVAQYFSEGYREDDDEWIEGDYAVDTDDEDYGVAVEKGYDKFLADIEPYGTIVEFNDANKVGELPDAIEEED